MESRLITEPDQPAGERAMCLRCDGERKQLRLWSRRGVLMSFGLVTLAGCASGGSSDVVYMDDPWNDPF
jgi:hypothetical protein